MKYFYQLANVPNKVLKYKSFKISNGCLDKFKKRHKIRRYITCDICFHFIFFMMVFSSHFVIIFINHIFVNLYILKLKVYLHDESGDAYGSGISEDYH
jgi:hypothetical protein